MHLKKNKVTFSRKDTFSLDATLGPVIAAGLRKFLEVIEDPGSCGGCPGSLTEPEEWEKLKIPCSVYENISVRADAIYHDCWTEQDEINLARGLAVWYWMIEEMIWAYETEPDDYNIYWKDFAKTLNMRTLSENDGFTEVTIDCDKDLERKYNWASICVERRYQRAMEYWKLFFRSLWW